MRSGILLCLLSAASLPLLSCRHSLPSNHPPDMPAPPSGPRSLWPGETVKFWASTSDPDYQDSVSFQFDWGDGDTSAWTPFSESAGAGVQHAWFNQGTYGVRARARDVRDAESGWSGSLHVSIAAVGFAPNVSVDHGHSCGHPSIAVGPPSGEYQPIYVAMQDGQSIAFQKSTDAGASWLADNQIVGQGSGPHVAADADGGIYIVLAEANRVYCVHSFDGGATWSSPARIDDCDSARYIYSVYVATSTTGHLFCAWNDERGGSSNLWTSISTDRGVTWSPNVNTASGLVRGVCVQPGTSDCFMATDDEYGGAIVYRSRDMGQTFEPGVQVSDDWSPREARVAADREHVVAAYVGGSGNGVTRARTLYTTPDTWGPCTSVTDVSRNSYDIALAMSASGRVHTAQMTNRNDGRYDIYYACSSDHGATWDTIERVNDDMTGDKWYPDIGADSAGYAYIVWEDGRVSNPGVWFSTNNPRPAVAGFRGRDTQQLQPRGKCIGPRGGTATASRLKPQARADVVHE
ncbi:MAG TPA: exo-alpha-sialidase [bacterium]|nr:exo-alpha-sialidase [bacterium]